MSMFNVIHQKLLTNILNTLHVCNVLQIVCLCHYVKFEFLLMRNLPDSAVWPLSQRGCPKGLPAETLRHHASGFLRIQRTPAAKLRHRN